MSAVQFYLNDVWKRTLEQVMSSGKIDEQIFEMYYRPSKLIDLQDDSAVVSVPSFINFTILNENKTKQMLEFCLQNTIGKHLSIQLIEEDGGHITQPDSKADMLLFANRFVKTDFSDKYTFTNFVVGRSNIQAQVASLTVASNPGLVYNPLFLHGNSGLGKTHLLMAIGNRIKHTFPSKRIAYISGSDFVEGVYQSSKEKKLDDFKESFKDLDVLLVDDIQFIAGKEKTHEIFFSVFNDLVNNRKQICLSADKAPSEIKGLEERIISRFNQGLTINIEAPEYETAVNILKMKINNDIGSSSKINDDVISYIANNFSQDVRQLEGALTRLLFYSINFAPGKDITLDVAVAAFQEQGFETGKSELTVDKIKRIVADYYGLTVTQISSKSRTKNIATARHVAMYLCRKLIDASYKDIGRSFGKRDHSTVINACEKVESMMQKSDAYAQAIRELESKIH
ncbi:MAG: chromosomal replication initiator protein DnaA [Erysipelotrichaceae bacterium]|nr:chromosomal replication initiator protein DnaA [Erysipelotrichaceae bacterium]MBR2552581.1 chromosomal replication initiator protein DnaA [Erysipelotrichaceae bacterium]